MPLEPKPGLTPTTAVAVTLLRSLLERAIQEGQSGAPLARLTAVILLDGANERAMHIAATAASVDVGEYDKFEVVYSKIVGAIGSSWDRSAWPDVRQLHRVRNLAQHLGVNADRDNLPT